jgi:hypothetical protein
MTPFQQAFADARAAGKKEFEFNGKPYHTRLKGEKAGGSTKASAESKAPPSRTAKATVSQTVRPETPAPNRRSVADIVGTVKRGLAKASGAGAIPTKTTTVTKTTGPKATTMAALKANKKDFSRAGVEARKLATMTGPKVARKK